MRKEGQELVGTKERTEGQSSEGGGGRGQAASPCTCSLRCAEAPAQKDSLSLLQTLANAIERK